MASQENRKSIRFKTENVPVFLSTPTLDESNGRNGHLIDVSETGAFLWGCIVKNDNAKVIFQPFRNKEVERGCHIVRRPDWPKDDRKWCAVEFNNPLSKHEVYRVCSKNGTVIWPGDRSTYKLAFNDRALVFEEARHIRDSRNNLFVWTMGILVSVTLTIWTLALENKLTFLSTLPAMIVLLGVYVLGVLSTVERARSINLREGFIAALDYYLRSNQGPTEYKGWINMKHCFAECGARRRAKVCSRGIEAKAKNSCRDEGKSVAASINSAKRIAPSLMDSFISLSAVVYAVLFVVLVTLFCISLAITLETTRQIPPIHTALYFMLGFISSGFLWRYKVAVVGVIIGVFLSFVAGTMFTKFFLNVLIILGSGIILGSLAWFIFRQLRALRVGRFSFETATHTWFLIFEHCIPIPETALQKTIYSETQWWRRKTSDFLNWLLRCQSHEDFRKSYEKNAVPKYEEKPDEATTAQAQ